MIALWINISIAIVWLMLSKEPSLSDFFIGYGIGFLLIILCSRLIDDKDYVRRVKGFVFFITLFLWEFLKSNINVAKLILFTKKDTISPCYFDYDIEGLLWFESILLSYCITLTPGTISVKLDPEANKLVVHCLDCKNIKDVISVLDLKFKNSILRFTR